MTTTNYITKTTTINIILTFLSICDSITAKSTFEIALKEVKNYRRDRLDGSCCGKSSINDNFGASTTNKKVCQDNCNLYVRFCLREFVYFTSSEESTSGKPSFVGKCSFGEFNSTYQIGVNYFKNERNPVLVSFGLNFGWSKSFSLLIEIFDGMARNGKVIDRVIKTGYILPKDSWVENQDSTSRSITFSYKIRVVCSQHYYGSDCSKYCKPRFDFHGYYTCDMNGNKICQVGWSGDNCSEAVCRTGCKNNKRCTVPNTCQCLNGWTGELCDQCLKFPGCKHGYCRTPFTCECFANYGGPLCDQDLNFCGRHKPCQNGGICKNKDNKEVPYECSCPSEFYGQNCTIPYDPCSKNLCKNKGICFPLSYSSVQRLLTHSERSEMEDFYCVCRSGYRGRHCEIDVDICIEENPCKNGQECVNLPNKLYKCNCQFGFMGDNCQLHSDICKNSKCHLKNTKDCLHTSTTGSHPKCVCQPGWKGTYCHEEVNECLIKSSLSNLYPDDAIGPCIHASNCMDLLNNYKCVCLPGWSGRNCTQNIDDCSTSPCLNGGLCRDKVLGYSCDCRGTGYRGDRCEIDTKPCDPSPCKNGAYCHPMRNGDYFCRCTGQYNGKNCEERNPSCPKTSTNSNDCYKTDPCYIHVTHSVSVSANRCGSNGHCVNLLKNRDSSSIIVDGFVYGRDYTCKCNSGWSGQVCEMNINDCEHNKCQNGATCIDKINNYQCLCPEGYQGQYCEININDCQSHQCQHNSQCVDSVNDYICKCQGQFIGKFCHIDGGLTGDACDNTTCLNNGKCLNQASSKFKCQCVDGFTGRICQLRTNSQCSIHPCKNGGTCLSMGHSYSCICPDGFHGSNCEVNVNECHSQPCQNNGTCLDRINHYVCSCQSGFAGKNCEVDLDECLSNPCPFGTTCIDKPGSHICKCIGDNCGVELEKFRGTCIYERRVYRNGETWSTNCQKCRCQNSQVKCITDYCGIYTCWQSKNRHGDPNSCKSGESCLALPKEDCLSRNCDVRGVCVNHTSSMIGGVTGLLDQWAASSGDNCLPNDVKSTLSTLCARIILTFHWMYLPSGATVEDVCREVRKLPDFTKLKRREYRHLNVGVSCDRSTKSINYQTPKVQISLSTTRDDHIFGYFQDQDESKPAVIQISEAITSAITQRIWQAFPKQGPGLFPILSAVKSVKLQTSLNTKTETIPNSYIMVIISVILLIIILCSVILMIFYHRKRKEQLLQKYGHKMNNLHQNISLNNSTMNGPHENLLRNDDLRILDKNRNNLARNLSVPQYKYGLNMLHSSNTTTSNNNRDYLYESASHIEV